MELKYIKGLRVLQAIVISLYQGSFPYIFFITRAKNIVRYTTTTTTTTNNNNDGLLKYTWWHKNYELQCAYISYN